MQAFIKKQKKLRLGSLTQLCLIRSANWKTQMTNTMTIKQIKEKMTLKKGKKIKLSPSMLACKICDLVVTSG